MGRFHSSFGHKTDIINVLLRTEVPLKARVAIGEGAIENVGSILTQSNAGNRVLLLTQPGEVAKWAAEVAEHLEESDYSVSTLELPDGEPCKSSESLIRIWQKMQECGLDRNDTLVAVGGGALSDVSGFAASTYLRGIRSVLVPTTLLAQVDAALGGKTGINLPAGKNLAGTFYLPDTVIVDPLVLKTLPQRELLSGLGEIIKYAYIENTIAAEADYTPGPRSLYRLLRGMLGEHEFSVESPELPGVILACIKMKMAVVGKDPHEGELRRCLNLGHTLAHAVEKATDYAVTHGEAVAIGLVFACRIAVDRGVFNQEELDELLAMLHKVGLPSEIPASADRAKLIKSIAFDKKREGEFIKFVLPLRPIGSVEINAQIRVSDFEELLEQK